MPNTHAGPEVHVYTGVSEVAVGRIMTGSGEQVNLHALSLVFIEAMGRLNRDLIKGKAEVTDADRIHLRIEVTTEV